jgi:hypothetical protein
MAAQTGTDPAGPTPALAVSRWSPGRSASPVTGRQLLALATRLRARGLRGMDVLRRSRDRAPPAGS